jgi:hypothetical protein
MLAPTRTGRETLRTSVFPDHRLYYCPLAGRRRWGVSVKVAGRPIAGRRATGATVRDDRDKAASATGGRLTTPAGCVTDGEHTANRRRLPDGSWPTVVQAPGRPGRTPCPTPPRPSLRDRQSILPAGRVARGSRPATHVLRALSDADRRRVDACGLSQMLPGARPTSRDDGRPGINPGQASLTRQTRRNSRSGTSTTTPLTAVTTDFMKSLALALRRQESLRVLVRMGGCRMAPEGHREVTSRADSRNPGSHGRRRGARSTVVTARWPPSSVFPGRADCARALLGTAGACRTRTGSIRSSEELGWPTSSVT